LSEEHVTRTIRLEASLDEVLRLEADEKNTSINSIVNDLIYQYVYNGRFFSQDHIISLEATTLESLLKGISKERVIEAGLLAGKLQARDNLLMRGMPINYESLKWFIIEVLEDYCGWFRCSYHELDEQYMFHLRHNLGNEWSCFLQAYLKDMVKDILDLDVEPEVLNGTITLRIPIKKTY
jgi:hypothetical protein